MGVRVAIERGANLGRSLRSIFEGGAAAGLTDAQLVERVAAGGESARTALAALVARHGPMALRACRAGSRDEHDADDAFQAVFLVLARKAATIRVGESLAPWLHGVALRTTAAARVASARRHALDRKVPRSEVSAAPPTPDDDLAALIHEELGKLPDRYRSPLVLCDLEGLSHEEAARRLGWPVGTLKSRQARGRERLRGRLIRRGVSQATALGLFATAAARANVSEGLSMATVDAAMAFLTGPGAAGMVPAPSALAREVLKAMIYSRWKYAGLALLTAGAVAAGIATITHGAAQRPAVPAPTATPGPFIPPEPGSLLQFHFVADASRDADAIAKALASDLDKPPEGYQWFPLSESFGGNNRDGLVLRKGPPGTPSPADLVLLKLDRENVTERDLSRVFKDKGEVDRLRISFRFTPSGARRFGDLTRSRLPEDDGNTKHRLAILVRKQVVSAPTVNSEIRDAAVIEFGTSPASEEVDRLFADLARVAESIAKPTAQAAATQAEALRLAREVDLPALAEADRVTIEKADSGDMITSSVPTTLNPLRDALVASDVPPSGGKRFATLIFSRGEIVIREVWVYPGGEWGFVRPGTSWTTGQSDRLWGLLKPAPGK